MITPDKGRTTKKYWLAGTEDKQNLADIIRRMSKRDQSALAEFYDRTSPMVHGLVQRIVNNPAIAEEVTLDIYLQVWRRAREYSKVRDTPTTWLILLARSQAIAAQRCGREEKWEDSMEPNTPGIDVADRAQESQVANGGQAVVCPVLNTLTPADREFIELAFYSGLSRSAIAEKLRLPIGTVKAGIRTGMLQLREHLRLSDDVPSLHNEDVLYAKHHRAG